MPPITSAGQKLTPRGPAQTNVLLDPNTGLPISVIEETDGSRRLAVDANLSVDQIVVDTRDLTIQTDAVAIGNKATGNLLYVNPDGSINADVILNAASDNVAIADATSGDKLKVNADGSVNVNIVSAPVTGHTVVSKYNEVSSVASGVQTTIVSYTVPALKTAILERIDTAGQNVGRYDVFVNGVAFDTQITYFGGSFNALFEYSTGTSDGFTLNAGDIVAVKILHTSVFVGNFTGRIQVLEIS